MHTSTLKKLADHANRYECTSEDVSELMYLCGFNACGVEYVHSPDGLILAYVNVGDTYAPTICRQGSGEYFVRSWGDWLEQAESDYQEETGTIRCGYCGEFTPSDPEADWRDTECESCGHNVATGDLSA